MLLPGSEIAIPNEIIRDKRARTFTSLDSHVCGFFTMSMRNSGGLLFGAFFEISLQGAALKFEDLDL